jgi:serine/threonine-protein kinase RsbW
MSDTCHTLRLAFPSHMDMLDFVQLLSDHAGRVGNLDDDSVHRVGVSVRESVVNAITHGNTEDETKRVVVEFQFEPYNAPARLVVRVLDQGQGFDPLDLADPCAPENLLKPCGRGLLFMRSFMDALTLRRAPGGGTEVRMVKKIG